MDTILKRCIPSTLLSLLLLCSCAVTPHPNADIPVSNLPADVSINRAAGRGGMLFVTLRLESGEKIPFLVDTGAGGTLLDKSWEPKLGKRLGTVSTTVWEGQGQANCYAAPRLYLGNTPLMTGEKIYTSDLGRLSGILGMDCLKHYCVQLDFEAGRMRFLSPDQVHAAELGKAFPLTFRGNIPYIHHAGILGGSETNLVIDIGCRVDGLEEKGAIKGLAQFLPDCIWDGETYSNLNIAAVEHAHALGLSFFARHLVTLDFPKRAMYLKQTSPGPLAGDSSMEMSNAEIAAPAMFLVSMKEKGQLPGLVKADRGSLYLAAYSNFGSQLMDHKGVGYGRAYFNSRHKSVNFDFWKIGDPSIYHYQITRPSEESPWKLQKAWRTDKDDHTVEEYPVH